MSDDALGGVLLFSRKTEEVVNLQRERAGDITDVNNVYTKKRAPPGAVHNLPTYVCTRGEKVEIFHGQAVLAFYLSHSSCICIANQ